MSKPTSGDSTAEPAEPPRVLVVDDDKGLADTYEIWLSDHYTVETAYNGVQATKRLDQDLDAILLDRRMPDVPGDQVLEDIRDQGLDCPVAMLTAVEPDTDIIHLPFDEYIVKPITQLELLETVDDLLLRSDFDSEAREFFAKESKAEALESRDPANLRDPDAARQLRSSVESDRESDRVRELEERLERLQRITSILRDIDQELVVATEREEIERTVCERLVDSEPYELAWIGDYTAGLDQTTLRTLSGIGDHDADGSTLSGRDAERIGPAVRAGDVQVLDDIRSADGGVLEPVDGTPEDGELAAGAVVPLCYRDTVYGVLTVYADRQEVFDDRELSVLSELGDTIANAINSTESKKLMLSDIVVELEFDVQDRDAVLVGVSSDASARIELKGLIPAASGELTCYLEVTGTTPEEFLEAATTNPAIDNVRGIGESSEEHLYECRVTDSTVLLSLIGSGANVDSMRAAEGSGHVSAEVAPEADVRTVVEAVTDRFDADLVAKREVERDVESTEDFRQDLQNRLTERQYSVLEAAYTAGYFDWPRGSTANEIADAMDVAPPTLHEHLRAAEKSLLEAFFGETGTLDKREALPTEQ